LPPGRLAVSRKPDGDVGSILYAGSMTIGGIARAKLGAAEAEVWMESSAFGVLADAANAPLRVCSSDAPKIGVGRTDPNQAKAGSAPSFPPHPRSAPIWLPVRTARFRSRAPPGPGVSA
jgi:hypothetical protein